MSKTRLIQPSNVRQQSGPLESIQQWIQDQKIEISRTNITKLQYAGRWGDEYDSYHTSLQKRNRYRDPAKFFRVMHKTPELFSKSFFYTQADTKVGEQIARAISDALSIAIRQARIYVRAPNVSGSPNQSSGLYNRMFQIGIGNRDITSATELQALTSNDTAYIANTTEYAARSETNALYYAMTGGILYYAAQQIKSRYKNLSVSFTFQPASSIEGTYSNKQVPVLRVAAKGNINARIRTPGKNYRSRERDKLRDKRLKLKAQRRWEAGRRGEYG